MSGEGPTEEAEKPERAGSFSVVYFNSCVESSTTYLFERWYYSLYLAAALIYYTLAEKFVYNSLLNLTAGRIERLSDSPFILFEATETIEVIEATSLNFTVALCIILFYGIYSLGKGNLTHRQYDIRLQAVAILGSFPFI